MRPFCFGNKKLLWLQDTAGQKGTGKWTAISALDMGMPLTLIGGFFFFFFRPYIMYLRRICKTQERLYSLAAFLPRRQNACKQARSCKGPPQNFMKVAKTNWSTPFNKLCLRPSLSRTPRLVNTLIPASTFVHLPFGFRGLCSSRKHLKNTNGTSIWVHVLWCGEGAALFDQRLFSWTACVLCIVKKGCLCFLDSFWGKSKHSLKSD